MGGGADRNQVLWAAPPLSGPPHPPGPSQESHLSPPDLCTQDPGNWLLKQEMRHPAGQSPHCATGETEAEEHDQLESEQGGRGPV